VLFIWIAYTEVCSSGSFLTGHSVWSSFTYLRPYILLYVCLLSCIGIYCWWT
jgi:hypothetical protein